VVKNRGSVRTEIIVVDNGSGDGSVEMVAREFPEVCLLVNRHNVGFAAANNRALRHAGGRYLLLLNSDTVVLPGALVEMVRYMDEHRQVGALGPRLLNADHLPQLSVFPFPEIFHDVLVILEINRWPLVGRLTRWYGRRRDAQMAAATGEVDWVAGACLLLRREALEQIGGLDERLFFGHDDTDLCFRLRRGGWPTVYLTEAAVVHVGSQSWSHISPRRTIWYYAGRLRYFQAHHALWERLLQRIAIAVIALFHLLRLLLSGSRSAERRTWISAYARVLALAVSP
jgi:GT2 family glycosyltransferase